jgi:hypothetical protein
MCAKPPPSEREQKREPVGVPSPYRLGEGTLGIGDRLAVGEFNRREIVLVVRLGVAADGCVPSGGGHGHAKVIEYGAAAHDHFPAGAVGVVADSRRVGVQVQYTGLGHPSPRLAVVQRGGPTGLHSAGVWGRKGTR